MTLAIAAVAVLLGAGLQSATGFGFALVSAPVLFAVLGPRHAVSAGALLSIELGLLTLATERRVPRVLAGEALALIAWSLPGLAIGAVALRELPDRVLSVLVAVGVLGALGLRLRGRSLAPGTVVQSGREPGVVGSAGNVIPPAQGWHTAAAGVTSGALSTATSLSGPPLVLHLVARGLSPDQMRDTLAALFVALAVLTTGALMLADTFELPSGLVVLLVAGIAGQVIGRRGFAWLSGGRHEDALLAVLAVTAVVALVSSVL
ncbi:MAG TPA: sulfite exporter TauE/SafE family protein [Solirubrobacteraceae bacterium]|nr:sulfite exporter TauE/SafE family protein [Solirubrobacteraceae bacterium]